MTSSSSGRNAARVLFAAPRPGPVQFLLHGGVARLQRVEDAAKLVQRLLYQTRLRAHLAAQPGHLDEKGIQVRRLAPALSGGSLSSSAVSR